ncbi:hypothetical protein [Streptomyces sp. NPDC101776]
MRPVPGWVRAAHPAVLAGDVRVDGDKDQALAFGAPWASGALAVGAVHRQ